jgi:hypothetical protein
VIDRLPDEAFALDRKYPHHWIRNGTLDPDGNRYIGGKMYLSKGGVIESYRQALKDKAPAEVIQHLENHIGRSGIEIKEEADEPKNIYSGRTGETKMKDGALPRIDEVDLNRIIARIDLARARSGDEIENGQLEKINSIARSELKKSDVYIFPVWVSNDLPDSYFTRMDPATTLRNYVSDFIDSRALMLSHAEDMFGGSPAEKMPIGSTFDSRITTRVDKQGNWVESWLYILRGVEIGGLNTDAAIRMIEAGIWKRVSVGFTIQPMEGRAQGKYVCEICNNELLSGECDHLPGFEYDGKLCIARIVGAGAREVSLAYMNAAQGTVVQKARELAQRGKLKEKDILSLEMSYGVRFFDINKKVEPLKVPATVVPDKGRNNKIEEQKMEQLRAILFGLTSMFAKTSSGSPRERSLSDLATRAEKVQDEVGLAAIGTELAEQVRDLLNEYQSHRELVAALPEDSRTVEAVQDILARAEDGKSHKNGLVESAIAEGVRFEGETFDQAHWKPVLERMPLANLSRQKDIWKAEADSKLAAGRKSKESSDGGLAVPKKEDKTPPQKSTGLPDEIYAVGQAHV